MTTPAPVYYPDTGGRAAAHLEPMTGAEKSKYRRAAFVAPKLYPGPVGLLIARELLAVDEFGYRLGGEAIGARLRDRIMDEWRKYEEAQAAP